MIAWTTSTRKLVTRIPEFQEVVLLRAGQATLEICVRGGRVCSTKSLEMARKVNKDG
jgi:hypothetical protein